MTSSVGNHQTSIVPIERIERAILMIRGQKVLLDRDLAELYGVETGALNRAVSRNADRFPNDFMFQLTSDEFENLKCHFGIASRWGGRRTAPYAFTEQGVAMLSSVLRSPRAARVNIAIMRAFVKLRELLASNTELSRRLDELEAKYDQQFKIVFDAIRQLMAPPPAPPPPPGRKIGFGEAREKPARYEPLKTQGGFNHDKQVRSNEK